MEEQIRAYIERLFAGVTDPASLDLKNEITQNTLDKYHDLLLGGKSMQEAYKQAISGVGDVSGLIGQAGGAEKAAGYQTTGAAGSSFSQFAGNGQPGNWNTAANAGSTPGGNPQQGANNNPFQVQQSQDARPDILAKTAKKCLWIAVVIIYFVISFMTGAWAITWLVFLIGAALDQVISGVQQLAKEKNNQTNGGTW